MALWPARYGAEHPVDVRFAPTEAERRHKSGASASRYANIGQGAVCQWHTFSTDRSGNGDVGCRVPVARPQSEVLLGRWMPRQWYSTWLFVR